MEREILGFEQDDQGDWRARLDCGHKRHLRHDPPRESRPELLQEQSRQAAVGGLIFCGRCAQRMLPEPAQHYKSTPTFDQDSLPAGILRNHSLKRGTWGKLIVLNGEVTFHEGQEQWVVTPQAAHVILPEVVHHLEVTGPVSLRVDFLKVPDPC